MEILPKELIFRFLIASDMGWRPKYSWQLLLFIINSPNRQKLEKRKTQRGRHAQRHFFRGSIGDYQNVMCRQRPDFQPPSPCLLPQQRNRSTLELHFWGSTWSQSCGDWGIVAGRFGCSPDMLRLFVQCCLRQMSREVSCRCSNDRVNVFIFYYLHL